MAPVYFYCKAVSEACPAACLYWVPEWDATEESALLI
jgi:hypothetical protein